MATPINPGPLLAHPGRATRALVDLDVLRENARRLAALSGRSELMAVVKADGYGHGATMVAREAVAGGATWLGVATVGEGVELRAGGLDRPILILGPIDVSEIDRAGAAGLDVMVGDARLVNAIVAKAKTLDVVPRLHLKVDTGMHRYGLSPSDAPTAVARLEAAIPGSTYAVCTHFAAADDPGSEVTARQLEEFRGVVESLRGGRPDIVVHAANSSATARRLLAEADITRVGIGLYGCGLEPGQLDGLGLRPAMSVVSRLMRVQDLEAGDGVSYGHTYVAHRPERVGLVPIGYADGYPRSLSNVGSMTIGEERYPVRGRVCMDQTVVGALLETTEAGAWVGVAGPALEGQSWDHLAAQAGTISYELLAGLGRRLVRLYHRSGRVVAVRDELGRYTDVDDHNNAPTA